MILDDGRVALDARDRRRPGRLTPPSRPPRLRRAAAGAVPVGLVAFSTDARLVVPPTTDRARSTTRSTACGPTAAPRWATRSTCRSRRPADAPHGRRRRHAGARPHPRRPSASPSRRPRRTPTSRRSWRRCSCPTAPTRPAPRAARRRVDAAAEAGVPGLHDRARHAGRRGRRPGPETGQMQTLNVPPDTETLAEIAETDRRSLLRGADRGGPGADLREPRLQGRLHAGGAGGHPVVRRRRPCCSSSAARGWPPTGSTGSPSPGPSSRRSTPRPPDGSPSREPGSRRKARSPARCCRAAVRRRRPARYRRPNEPPSCTGTRG